MGAGGRSSSVLWKCVHFLMILSCALAVDHNLPDNIELVDPKDLGLDSQFDLDKLLGNVKALPIDTNGLSGKSGLKTQVLTVGFDGSEGLNLDDFELPQLKNDENSGLAHAAFKSFKNFFKNSSRATSIDESGLPAGVLAAATQSQQQQVEQRAPPAQQVVRTVNGKRRTMMKRRKVIRVNGTTTTPPPPPPQQAAPQQGPKVIELDSSQIEKLIASGKIGPPKSITPGGPQVIELGQSDLDALLSGDNAEEIKQILEGGDTLNDFDLSQLSSQQPRNVPPPPPQIPETTTAEASPPPTPRVVDTPASIAQLVSQVSSPVPTETTSGPTSAEDFPQQQTTLPEETSAPATVPVTTTSELVSTPISTTPSTTTGHPIIYQYSSLNEQRNSAQQLPPQGFQGSIPLQFYSSHHNGEQVAKQIKHPTFEFISAPPVSFSSSILPNNSPAIQQSQPLFFQPQGFQPSFIQQQQQPQYVIQNSPFPQPTTSKPSKSRDNNFNKIIPAPQISSQTEQVNKPSPSVSNNIIPNNLFAQSLHKVNLPQKLATPSPQLLHSVLNQVPASFQPSIIPNHVVSSPVLDPVRLNQQQNQGNFLRPQQQQGPSISSEPFRNTQLFNPGSGSQPTSPPSTSSQNQFRFPTTSNILGSPPSRFRTSESSNPFFQSSGTSPFGSLVLNSFVAGDGLNYRPRSREDFRSPGI